jgi:predicted permease
MMKRHRLLLSLMRIFPEDFRKRHAEEMIQFIEDERARGGGLRFWTVTLLDLLVTAGRMRWKRPPGVGRRSRRVLRVIDLRHALRSILATPLSSGIIVLTLALGIGLVTAIFSVVDSILLAPLPYREPERLFHIQARWTNDGVERAHHTGSDFAKLRRSTEAFADLAAVTSIRQNLTGTETPLQVQVGWASRNLFSVLGVSPSLGSGFTEDAPPGTAVLSHELWVDAFGARADIVGSVVRLDDHPYTVAGVLPRGFVLHLPRFPPRIDLWKVPDDWWQNGDAWASEGLNFAIFDIIGRLDDGVTPLQAREEMKSLARALREEETEYARAGLDQDAIPLHESVVAKVRAHLLLLLGAVAFVLLVGCCNVMSLMLARARARASELGLRLALGSSRAAIAGLFLGEALLYALVGGGLGVAFAWGAIPAIAAYRPENLPPLGTPSLHAPVLAVALSMTIGSVVVFGLAPAFSAARGRSSAGLLLSGSRSTGSRKQMRLSRSLVVLQLSLSLVLWIGAALLTRSLARLAEVHPGFEYDDVLTFSISVPGTKYPRPDGTDRFFRELESRIESLPGVRSAGVVWPLPLSRRVWSNLYEAGGVLEQDRAYAEYRLATSGFFETMSIPLVEGRNFSLADPHHVVIVSRALSEHAFPGASAVGRTLRATPWGGGLEAFEVIGVAADVRYADLREAPQETIYFDSRGWSWNDWEVDFVVAVSAEPESCVPGIRAELARLDPTVPLARPRPMDAYVADHLAQNRFALTLIGLFAVIAGALAVIGLYGVVSCLVSESRREIGIRMALGSDRAAVLRWIYGQCAILIAIGIVLGIAGSLGLSRFIAALLVGVTPTDLGTFAAMGAILAFVASAACYLPARRAARIDPMSVLRAQ